MPKKTQGTHDKQEALVKQEQAWVPKKLETTRELQTSSRSSTSNDGKLWVPIQHSTDTKPKENILKTKEAVQLQELSSAFFMTINPIYDPSPVQDTDKIVEEILCQWGMQ